MSNNNGALLILGILGLYIISTRNLEPKLEYVYVDKSSGQSYNVGSSVRARANRTRAAKVKQMIEDSPSGTARGGGGGVILHSRPGRSGGYAIR